MSLDVEWDAQDSAWTCYADIPTVDLSAVEVIAMATPGDQHPWRIELEWLWTHDRNATLQVLDSVVTDGFRSPMT